MSHYQPYPSYKKSGVEWLGQVPEHWIKSKIKYEFSVVGGSTPKSDNESFWDGDIIWVTPSDLSKLGSFYIEDSQRKITRLGLSSCGTTLVEKNSLILSTRAPIGSIALASTVMCTNQGCKSLIPKQFTNSLFYAYLLSANSSELNNRGKGTTFLELSGEELASLEIPVPCNDEQTAIANFLDRETAKIDTLIAKQEHMIELLNEKRSALISHAVTKGLNPDVPMKDSGVEWLGEVPEHWNFDKFRYIFNFSKGLTITKADLKETGIPCVNYGEIHSKYGFEISAERHALKCVDSSYIETDKSSLMSNGDFVFADTSEDLEGAGNFTHVSGDTNIFAGYHTIIARQTKNNNARFLAYLIDSKVFRTQIRLAVKGVKVFSITQAILRDSFVWLPNITEQTAIANFLDDKTAKIDTLIAKVRQAIELMKERRTALISAAVTGKIDVRGMA